MIYALSDHIRSKNIVLGIILAAAIGVLFTATSIGVKAISLITLRRTMTIRALPFTFVIFLMMISFAKTFYSDNLLGKAAIL